MRAICGVFCCCVVDVHFLCCFVSVMWLCASDPISFLKRKITWKLVHICWGWLGLIIPIFKYILLVWVQWRHVLFPIYTCTHVQWYWYMLWKTKIYIFSHFTRVFSFSIHTHECYLTHNNKSVEMLVLGQEKHHNNFFIFFHMHVS